MATIRRATGITVTTEGAVELAQPGGIVKRGVKRAGAPLRQDAAAIVAEMQRQDAALVDVVPLVLAPAAKQIKRGVNAPPRQGSVTLDVPLQQSERAVVLVEDEGEYRWIVSVDASDRVKRSGKSTARDTSRVTFHIELTPSPPSPAKRAKRSVRSWIAEKAIGKATAYVFRFAVNLMGKPLVRYLERNVTRGLVFIGSEDPAQWRLLANDDPLPRPASQDRPARVLLLVHGTFSSTLGSYGALGSFAAGRAFLTGALQAYDFVLGFDHATLSADPEANASDLLKRLRKLPWPHGVHIEMVAFSRAGLVARSFIEKLLPGAGWDATVGRVVFAGCTNNGTLLAEPANWNRFADHYTNLALGATRALSFIPGALPATTIAGQVIQGVGTLVKALVTGAVTDDAVPGLAAMEPDGPFVAGIKKLRPGKPSAGMKFYAITANFQPRLALKDATSGELAPKFLLSLANWGADKLYGEANDLVVNVSSMTAFGPGEMGMLEGQLDYGTTGTVYHTNYFAQPATANKLSEWFGIAAAAAALKRGVKRGLKRGVPAAGRARPPVGAGVAKASARGHDRALARIERLVASKSTTVSELPGSAKAAPKRAVRKAAKKKDGPRALRPHRSIQITDALPPQGMGPKYLRSTDAPPGVGARGIRGFRGGKVFGGGEEPDLDAVPPYYLSDSGEDDSRGEVAFAFAPARPMKRGIPRKPAGTAVRKPASADVECFFKAEMAGEIIASRAAPVDVTISRQMLEMAAGKIGGGTAAMADKDKKLIVELGELRELRPVGKRSFEVDVPQPGQIVTKQFSVRGDHPGDAQLIVHFRQGSVPLASIQLTPRVVAALRAGAPQLAAEASIASFPALEPPLDELRIFEQNIGNTVFYVLTLSLPSLNIREEFESKPINSPRDAYVQSIMKNIGDAWISSQRGGVESFEADIRSIGGQMFDQLIPLEMQRLLWSNRDLIMSVQIISREPFIPWELVYIKDPGRPQAEAGSKFLGQLGALRWLQKSFPPSKLRIRKKHAYYLLGDAGPSYQLPNAAKEAAVLRRLFDAQPIDANVSDLQRLLREQSSFDLLHITCHGVAAGEQFAQAQLFIKGQFEDDQFQGETLKAVTVEQTARLAPLDSQYRPIVVLNACESARANRSFTNLGGFAHAFVGAGAGAFVGSHWSIGDTPALAFIEAMYEAVTQNGKSKMTLSEAVTRAREVARDKDDATWLAYVVYGHPRASVSVE